MCCNVNNFVGGVAGEFNLHLNRKFTRNYNEFHIADIWDGSPLVVVLSRVTLDKNWDNVLLQKANVPGLHVCLSANVICKHKIFQSPSTTSTLNPSPGSFRQDHGRTLQTFRFEYKECGECMINLSTDGCILDGVKMQ